MTFVKIKTIPSHGEPPDNDDVMDDVLKVSLFSNVLNGRHQYFIIESFFEHLDVLAAIVFRRLYHHMEFKLQRNQTRAR